MTNENNLNTAHCDGDGNLQLDGVNDWAWNQAIEAINGGNTFVAQSVSQNKGELIISTSSAVGTGIMIWYQQSLWLDGKKQSSDITDVDGDIVVLRCNATNEGGGMGIGRIRPTDARGISRILLKSIVRFDRILTDSEIDWVKSNMLVSQEPKKFTINLWYYNNGEPILLTSKKVNNGSEIGELPQFDISSTECTNEWYYDLTLSDDALVYDDDYVESDLNLYCSTMPIYERMLDELEEEGLRDSLVCFYSPKWQGLTKESVLADATLVDLSGNGYDMELVGYNDTMTIINSNNDIVFEGSTTNHNYAVSSLDRTLEQYTALIKSDIVNGTQTRRNVSLFLGKQSKGLVEGSNIRCLMNGYGFQQSFYSGGIGVSNNRTKPSDEVFVMSNEYLIIDSTKIGFTEGSYKDVPYIGLNMCSASYTYVPYSLAMCVLFDRTLNDSEITKVKQILKL